MYRIVLDAGHGMETPGKRCLKSLDANETREWWLNDRICRYAQEMLKEYSGYELMRVDDRTGKADISLTKRTTTANAWSADVYISVHHNAGVNGGNGGGIVSIAYTKASEKSKEYQKLIYDEVIATTKLKGNRSEPLPLQNLHVCRETNMPAVLVEFGFMDSSTDVPIILTEEFAKNSARGLVNALGKMGNLKRIPNTDTELAKACEVLASKGIINSPDYWAKGGGYSDENTVHLIKAFARYVKG